MEDKDHIKDLFRDKLNTHTEKVNPKIWNAVQSQIGGVGATTAAGISVLSKSILGIIGVVGLTVIGVVVYNTTKELPKQEEFVKQDTILLTKENKEKQQENSKSNKANTAQAEKVVTQNTEVTSKKEDLNTLKEAPVKQKILADTNNKENTAVISDIAKENVTNLKDNTEKSVAQLKDKKDIEIADKISAHIVVSNLEYDYNFSLSNNDYDYLEWNLGDNEYSTENKAHKTFSKAGIYIVKARLIKGDIETVLEYAVEINSKEIQIDLPNVVTFNNDGFNDKFVVKSEGLENFHIVILTKDNVKVFESSDPNFVWNGRDLQGNEVVKGNYFYLITAYDSDGNPINKYQTLKVL